MQLSVSAPFTNLHLRYVWDAKANSHHIRMRMVAISQPKGSGSESHVGFDLDLEIREP